MQGVFVLFYCGFFQRNLCGIGQRDDQSKVVAAQVPVFQRIIGRGVTDAITRLPAGFGVPKANDNAAAFPGDPGMTDIFVTQQGANVGGCRVHSLGQCPLHVYLH